MDDNKLFTAKSLSQLNSPSDLKDYIRIANPGLWIVLAAIIVFLVGVVIWGTFGTIESAVDVTAEVSGGTAVCTVTDAARILEVEEGMQVRIGGQTGEVTSVDYVGGTFTASVDLPDGSADGRVILRTIRPITYITN